MALTKPIVATIKGREITLKAATAGQLAQMGRAVSAVQRAASDGQVVVSALTRMLDVLMMLVDSDEDRQWIDDGLTDGSIDVDDMTPLLQAFDPNGEAPKNGPAPVKRARAARR